MTGATRPVWDSDRVTHPTAPTGQRPTPGQRRAEAQRRVAAARRAVQDERRAVQDERREGYSGTRGLTASSTGRPAPGDRAAAPQVPRPAPTAPGGASFARRTVTPDHVASAGGPHDGRPPAVPGHAGGGRWRLFVRRYGWRAYALPVLAVVTVLALFSTNSPDTVRKTLASDDVNVPAAPTASALRPSPSTSAAPSTTTNGKISNDPGNGSINQALPALALPPGPSYTTRGDGTFSVVPGSSAVIGAGALRRFTVEVENGVTGVDRAAFGRTVVSALSDPRSWRAAGDVALQRVSSGAVDFRVSLSSSMTVRDLCGYSLPVETSCYDGGQQRVVLNVGRWVRGAKLFSSDLATYRSYAVNHEVGHALGHNHSHVCLPGGLAPVMMQQTIGGRTASGQLCRANPWPYPTGAQGAPGPEDPPGALDDDFFRRNS
jgi:hypothetical protein